MQKNGGEEPDLGAQWPVKGLWKAKVATGKPAAAIFHAAQEQGADLIVMGTHGRSCLCHTLLIDFHAHLPNAPDGAACEPHLISPWASRARLETTRLTSVYLDVYARRYDP